MDFVELTRQASDRFLAACSAAGPGRAVPACPGWDSGDLLWHLTEVQDFWGSVVGARPAGPDAIDKVVRPAGEALPDLFEDRSARMVAALAEADPYDECWSWDETGGGSVAWVRRRQAHEAIVHRVDAEQAAGWDPAPIAPDVAADGVDECLRVQLGGIPSWATFRGGGGTVELVATDTGARWWLELGRMTGTSLSSGRHHDLSTLRVLEQLRDPSALVAAPAVDLYLWLWGRGDQSGLEVDGDEALVGSLRALAADAT